MDPPPANAHPADADDLISPGNIQPRGLGVDHHIVEIRQVCLEQIFPFDNRPRQEEIEIVKRRLPLDQAVGIAPFGTGGCLQQGQPHLKRISGRAGPQLTSVPSHRFPQGEGLLTGRAHFQGLQLGRVANEWTLDTKCSNHRPVLHLEVRADRRQSGIPPPDPLQDAPQRGHPGERLHHYRGNRTVAGLDLY